MTDLADLMQKLGYQFQHLPYLRRALTHRSYQDAHNERLEFLGDSVLNLAIGSYLFQQFPQLPEGELSRLRASLVKGETLAELAREKKLPTFLLLGAGEIKAKGHERRSTLADALEAVIGAIYLDSDFNRCREVILSWFDSRLQEGCLARTQKDAKSRLQEYLQARKKRLPDYRVFATQGQAHQQQFNVSCEVVGFDYVGKGCGSSKRRAEQQAASEFLHWLVQQGED